MTVSNALGQDPSILESLVANRQRFLAFLEPRMGSRADAEDLLQEAYVRGLEKQDQLADPDSAVAWFYRILRNALTDWYRKRGAEDRALAEAGAREDRVTDPEDDGLFTTVCSCATEIAATLKPEYGDILRRVDIEEMPVKDYAEATGITPNNAGVRLHRARAVLRERLLQSCDLCIEHRCLDCTCKANAG